MDSFKVGDLVYINDAELKYHWQLIHPFVPCPANPHDWVITSLKYLNNWLRRGIEICSPTFAKQRRLLTGTQGLGTLDISPDNVYLRNVRIAKPVADSKQRNDGEYCLYCGCKNVELVLFTHKTLYCPNCETKKPQPQKLRIDREWDNLIESIDELLEQKY